MESKDISDNMTQEEIKHTEAEAADTVETAEGTGIPAPKKKTKKDRILQIVKIVFLVAVFVFMGRYFYRNWDDIKNLDMKLNWGIFAGSMILYFAYKLMLAGLWHYITWLYYKCY